MTTQDSLQRQLHGVTLSCAVVLSVVAVFAQNIVKVSEASIRDRAVRPILPEYPVRSLKNRHEGVAVARVIADLDGTVVTVDILQAPDEPIAESVKKAVAQWRIPEIRVVGSARHFQTQGKLTFYFQLADGGRVRSPNEFPGNETVFDPPQRGRGSQPVQPGAPRPARPALREIGPDDLKKLSAGAHLQLLDVREREEFKRQHTQTAMNIPLDELFVRARIELRTDGPVIVDCSYGDPVICRQAGIVVQSVGISAVAILIL